MMKIAKYLITLWFIFALVHIVGAEEVKEIDKNRFETGKI